MWLDVIALVVLGAFATRGLLRGTLASALSLFGLGVAYAAAIALGPDLGTGLVRELDLSPLLALPLGGTLAFAGAYVVFGLFGWFLRWLERRYRGRGPRGGLDRLGGALFGAARGCVIVLLIGWLVLWLDALRATGQVPWLPETGPSTATRVSQSVIELGVEAALGDAGPAASAAARFAARPAESIERLRSLIDDPRLVSLREDRAFWSDVEFGHLNAALERASFRSVASDASIRQTLAELGLVSDAAARDALEFRREVSNALKQVGPRIHAVRSDPELASLATDPELQQMLQSGDTVGLLAHAGFRRLLERALLDPPAGTAPRAAGPSDHAIVNNYRF